MRENQRKIAWSVHEQEEKARLGLKRDASYVLLWGYDASLLENWHGEGCLWSKLKMHPQ